MKILYIAYSCLPDKGSEEKIGWNVPLASAETNEVIVVTKEEHRAIIEQYIAEHDIKNPVFYFVDIPQVYKKICTGSAYSARLNIWHKRAFPIVEEICKNECVDIVHQITPIEFRSIGPYHKIPNIHFVCGPLGGGEYISRGLYSYALSHIHIEAIRSVLNFFYKIKYRITKQLAKCDYFLLANYETLLYMQDLIKDTNSELYFDNGLSDLDINDVSKTKKESGDKIVFLSAGRLAYRKGHRLLLDVLKQLPENLNCEFRFVGGGPEIKRLQRICRQYHLEDKVVFTGRIAFAEMADEYKNADVFIMPSIRETTGAVLLESASKRVPIITVKKFGGAVLFDENSAYFYWGNSKREYIDNLKGAIMACVEFPAEISIKAENAWKAIRPHTWNNKMEKYNEIYRSLLEKQKKSKETIS